MNQGIWQRRETRKTNSYYSNLIASTCLTRITGFHHILTYLFNPFKLIFTYFIYLLSYFIPEYDKYFNFFYHNNKVGWPSEIWCISLEEWMEFRLKKLQNFLPSWVFDWYRWDEFGLGYLDPGTRLPSHNGPIITDVTHLASISSSSKKSNVYVPTRIPLLKSDSENSLTTSLSVINDRNSQLRQFSFEDGSGLEKYANLDSVPNSQGSAQDQDQDLELELELDV